MAAYRQVYDSRHLQADCQELGSALEPYALQSSMGNLILLAHPGSSGHGAIKQVWYYCHVRSMEVPVPLYCLLLHLHPIFYLTLDGLPRLLSGC